MGTHDSGEAYWEYVGKELPSIRHVVDRTIWADDPSGVSASRRVHQVK